MGWSGQTWMRLTKEATYGTFDGSAIAASILYPTLYGANPFSMRKVPQRQLIRTADADNRRKIVVAARHAYAGSLSTILHPEQAAYWIEAASTLTANVLPSYTIDYWDSVQAHRFTGCRVQSMKISSNAQSDYLTTQLAFIGQQRDASFTVFAAPAQSVFSTLTPYVHSESAGLLTLAGSALTKYKMVDVTIANVLAPTWDELPYISALYYCGRDLDFNLGPQYLTAAFRAALEAQSPLTFVLNWTRVSPAHALTLTCRTKAYVATTDDDLPLDGAAYQNLGIQVFYDAASTSDFTTTVT